MSIGLSNVKFIVEINHIFILSTFLLFEDPLKYEKILKFIFHSATAVVFNRGAVVH